MRVIDCLDYSNFSDNFMLRINKITYFDERLDLVSPCQSLCTHALRHFARVTLDSSDNCMGVGTLLRALIVLLDDYHLLASLAALKSDGDLQYIRQ